MKFDIFRDCINEIPESITSLTLFNYYGTPINSTNIRKLKVYCYSGILTSTTFGSSLTSLHIGSISQDFKFECLPNTILSLRIDRIRDLKIKSSDSLPSSLTSLQLCDFNQDLDNILPSTLQQLILGDGFNKDITPSLLPKGLNKFYYYGKSFQFKFYDQHQSIFKLIGFMEVPIGLLDFSRLLSLKGFGFRESINEYELIFPKLIQKLDLLYYKGCLSDDEPIFSTNLLSAKVPLSAIKYLPTHSVKSLSVLCNFNFKGSLSRKTLVVGSSLSFRNQQQEPLDEKVKLFIEDQLSQILSFTNLESLSFLSISSNEINLSDYIPKSVRHLEYQFGYSCNKNDNTIKYIIPDHIESFKINLITNNSIPKYYPDSVTCLELKLESDIIINPSTLPKYLKTLIIKSSEYSTSIISYQLLPSTLESLIIENNQKLLINPDLLFNLFNMGILKLVDVNNKSVLKHIKSLRFKK